MQTYLVRTPCTVQYSMHPGILFSFRFCSFISVRVYLDVCNYVHTTNIRLKITWSKYSLWAGVELFDLPRIDLPRIIMWHFHWNQREREDKTESVCFIFQFHQILCGYYCCYSTCSHVYQFQFRYACRNEKIASGTFINCIESRKVYLTSNSEYE